jgi:hypothetical protein
MYDQRSLKSCHERHAGAADVVLSFLEPSGSGPPSADRYIAALDASLEPHFEDLRCGHFSKWLWKKLLDHLDDLARYGDNRVLESTVDRWYELSGQMILSDPPLQDSRSECVNEGKWIKIFKERVSSANSPIPEILLRHLHRPTLLVRQPNLQIVYNCLSEVADVVLNKRPDLQEQFLHVAINTCKLAPGLGWKLLTTVVEIVAKDPVKRLPLLTKFIQPMSAEHRDGLFRDVHRTVNEWVDQQTDKRCEAQLRRDQADLVPYLLGHRKRDLRLSTLKSTSRVEALVRVLDNQGRPIEISGEVRDVSNGIGDGRGSGIHIHAEDWSFLPIGGPHPFPPREIMAKSLKDDSVACFSTASVELTYPPRRKLTCTDSHCIRGFDYNPKYKLSGGGLVLRLRDTGVEFKRWCEFVDSLPPVDYED